MYLERDHGADRIGKKLFDKGLWARKEVHGVGKMCLEKLQDLVIRLQGVK